MIVEIQEHRIEPGNDTPYKIEFTTEDEYAWLSVTYENNVKLLRTESGIPLTHSHPVPVPLYGGKLRLYSIDCTGEIWVRAWVKQ